MAGRSCMVHPSLKIRPQCCLVSRLPFRIHLPMSLSQAAGSSHWTILCCPTMLTTATSPTYDSAVSVSALCIHGYHNLVRRHGAELKDELWPLGDWGNPYGAPSQTAVQQSVVHQLFLKELQRRAYQLLLEKQTSQEIALLVCSIVCN